MADTLPLCVFYPRLGAIRVAGFTCPLVREIGDVAIILDSGMPIEDLEVCYSQALEHLSRIFGQWISMLDLDDLFKGKLPYIINLDDSLPKEKRGKAYTFTSMIYMIEELYRWSDDKLYTLYERSIENAQGPPYTLSDNRKHHRFGSMYGSDSTPVSGRPFGMSADSWGRS